jgi:hypothetical protein
MLPGLPASPPAAARALGACSHVIVCRVVYVEFLAMLGRLDPAAEAAVRAWAGPTRLRSRARTMSLAEAAARDFLGRAAAPGSPTAELPGSEGKILVMIDRASRRLGLFHPEDAAAAPTPEGEGLPMPARLLLAGKHAGEGKRSPRGRHVRAYA